ncbi:MAG: hypothetical protein O3C58_13980, partial [Nitrospinae bacterium]|nr:hypothetical protein [Nitrospinota bacterium]
HRKHHEQNQTGSQNLVQYWKPTVGRIHFWIKILKNPCQWKSETLKDKKHLEERTGLNYTGFLF